MRRVILYGQLSYALEVNMSIKCVNAIYFGCGFFFFFFKNEQNCFTYSAVIATVI